MAKNARFYRYETFSVSGAFAAVFFAGCVAVSAVHHRPMFSLADADYSTERPMLKDEFGGSEPVGAVAAVGLPQVQFFETDGCPPCVAAKKYFSGQKKISYVVMPRPNPEWCEKGGYPAFAWQHRDGTWSYYFGFKSGADFEKFYFETVKKHDHKHSA